MRERNIQPTNPEIVTNRPADTLTEAPDGRLQGKGIVFKSKVRLLDRRQRLKIKEVKLDALPSKPLEAFMYTNH